MKAAVATRYGPPEVARVIDVPRPAPRADELLVRVHATTVNRTDCGFRGAHPLEKLTNNHDPTDATGRITRGDCVRLSHAA